MMMHIMGNIILITSQQYAPSQNISYDACDAIVSDIIVAGSEEGWMSILLVSY